MTQATPNLTPKWNITLLISRQKHGQPRHFDSFRIDVDPAEYVLDAVEKAWAFHDRSLTFRHACHHSTCGACGMLVNGVEKLSCITPLSEVTHDGGTLKVEPLRNFPLVSDLVVDQSSFYTRLEQSSMGQVAPLNEACLPFERKDLPPQAENIERLVDCIECGLCISVCPAAATSTSYMGPAVLAAIQHAYTQKADPALLDLADSADGVWRCHSAFECSAVCPSSVDPAWRIMDLRRKVILHRFSSFFSRKEAVQK